MKIIRDNGEFLGIGRTWFTVQMAILLTAAMVFTDDLRIADFIITLKWLVGYGAGKSGLEVIMTKFAKKKEKPPTDATAVG